MTAVDIQRTINKCRDNGCVLLVLVCDDENCDEVSTIWNSEEVTSVVGGNKCEKIQLNSGSLEYTNFAQLYPVVVIPSVFIINNEGIPLDMLYGNFTSQELIGKINKAIEAHKNGKSSLLVRQRPMIQKDPNKAVGNAHTTSSVVNHRRTAQRDKINNNGRVQQTSNSSTMAATRSSGSNIVHRTVQHRDVNQQNMTKPSASSTTCRLQLKVVNSNNKVIEQFHPSDTLCVVKERASKGLGIPLESIILEKSYPAYTFVVEDEVKTLAELQLTPTAMLIVKQKTANSWSSVMLSRILELLFYLLSLLIWPLQTLGGFVYGSSTSSSSASSGSQSNSRPSNWKDKSWQTQRRGNIASLRQDDDDDDQNTYNGNSTQQQ